MEVRHFCALRYFIPNDLIDSDMEQTLSFGYNFFMRGQKSILKAQYFYRLDKNNPALLRTGDQVRVGWLFCFCETLRTDAETSDHDVQRDVAT